MIAHNTPTASEPIKLPEVEHALRQALQTVLFANRLTITPRRAGQIARTIAESFVRYDEGRDNNEVVQNFGADLVKEGLGHQALMALTTTLHGLTWERQAPGETLPVSVRYCYPLLVGYMQAREAYLLQEQERTRLALERARIQKGL